MSHIYIQLPLQPHVAAALRARDQVLITGRMLGARDAAHARLSAALQRGERLPVELANQVIYYVGPAPARDGFVIGPAGPTTSSRMDPYTEALLKAGVRGFIGKGFRSEAVKQCLRAHGAVYFAAIGGAAAIIAQTFISSRVIAYEDLGSEAIREFEVVDFPAIVVNDIHGGDAYEQR